MADANFAFAALAGQVATNVGHYSLVGDHNGPIAIRSVTFTADAAVAGQPATGIVTLSFFAPLPDDRYTLRLSDALVDVSGNKLDGEGNAAEPQAARRVCPVAMAESGGDFVARFTIDSRPEIGTATGSSTLVDANGNLVIDPEGQDNDAVNRDLAFHFGISSDFAFAGDFTAVGAACVVRL